jgi:hypothetical protein
MLILSYNTRLLGLGMGESGEGAMEAAEMIESMYTAFDTGEGASLPALLSGLSIFCAGTKSTKLAVR